jgi:hypothetical protein
MEESSVIELSESGAAVARARGELLGILMKSAHTSHQPQELIRQVAGNRDRDAYRAALMSLLASGVVERADGWTIRLSSGRISSDS